MKTWTNQQDNLDQSTPLIINFPGLDYKQKKLESPEYKVADQPEPKLELAIPQHISFSSNSFLYEIGSVFLILSSLLLLLLL